MSVKEHKLNKKRILIIAVAVMLLVSAVFAAFHLFGSKVKSSGAPLPQGYSISLEPPADGSDPGDYTALQNIGYIVGRLARREYYHSESVSTADAAALGGMVNVRQNVVGSKDYKDGILIVCAVSTSESSFAPSKAIQRFYGKDTAIVRTAASDKKSDWNGIDTQWSEGEPSEILDKDQHTSRYGLWATEFSDYVVNADTLLSEDAVPVLEGDEYILTVSLSVSEDAATGKKDSTEYYKRQMRTMGDLDDYPSFKSAELTFHFTKDWTLNKLETHEIYSSKKGFTAECDGKNVVTFSYDEASVDVSDYDSYFCRYADAAATGPEQEELSAFDYLTQAFAPVLTNESTAFAISGKLAGQEVAGAALVRMNGASLEGLQVRLGGLEVFYGGDAVALKYKDFFGKMALSDLLPLFGSGMSVELPDMSALESAVGEGTFVRTETGATLSFAIALGTESIPLTFEFSQDGEEIAWERIGAKADLFGIEAELSVTPSQEEQDFTSPDLAEATDLKPLVQAAASLVQGKSFEVGINYVGGQFGLRGSLLADLSEGVALQADLTLAAGGKEFPVALKLIGEDVWIGVAGIRVSSSLSELESCLKKYAEYLPQAELPALDFGAADIVAAVLSLDFDGIVKQLALNESGLTLKVDGDALLAGLKGLIGGTDLKVGELSAAFDAASGQFAVNVLGAEITLCAGEQRIEAPTDASGYVPLSKFLEIADAALAMANAKDIAFTFAGNAQVSGVQMPLELSGRVTFADGLQILLDFVIDDAHNVRVYYCDGNLQFGYNGYKMNVAENELKTVADSFSSLFASQKAGTSQFAAPLMLFGADGIDLASLIGSIQMAVSGDALQISLDLSKVLSGGAAEGLQIAAEKGTLCLRAESVSAFGLTVKGMQVTAQAGEGALDGSVAGKECSNVFEFLLNAYTQIAQTDDLSLSVEYDAADLYALVEGRVSLGREESTAQVTLSLQFDATLLEGGKAAPTGSHYIRLTVLDDWLYAGYSTVGFEGGNPLKVKMPVSALFEAGNTVLPLLAPLLGIGEDVYYFEFVNRILGGAYENINSGIFGVMDTQEWCDLILNIIDEYTAEDVAAKAAESAAQVTADLDSLRIEIASDGLKVTAAALYGGAEIAVPADADGYIDVSTIAQLLQDLKYSYRYADTGGYRLSGTVELKLHVLGMDLLTLPISLDIRVGFEDGADISERAPYVYIKTFVPKKSLVLNITRADTMTEIVIRGGKVYMLRSIGENADSSMAVRREFVEIKKEYHFPQFHVNANQYYYDVTTRYYYTTASSDYRVMTLADFAGGGTEGILQQVYYIFNLHSDVTDIIDGQIEENGSQGSETVLYDAGDMVNSYSAVRAGDTLTGYSLELNLAAITGDADTFDIVSLNIGRSFSQTSGGVDYYDLTSLEANMSMLDDLIEVKVKFRHEKPGSGSEADELSRQVIDLLSAQGEAAAGSGMQSGSLPIQKQWYVDREETERLCEKCNSAEVKRWGTNNWEWSEAVGDWVQIG